MFEYKGCKGERKGRLWHITFPSGRVKVAALLETAKLYCDNYKASPV